MPQLMIYASLNCIGFGSELLSIAISLQFYFLRDATSYKIFFNKRG